jgi:hypothetical protein
MNHLGRLPLHLQYKFESPGVYEIRYTYKWSPRGPQSVETLYRSEWTSVEVQPAAEARIGPPPQDPVEILSDFLPSLLGFPNEERLSVVLGYLYHPEEVVRRYAANSLGYWPDDVIRQRLEALARSRGLSDVVAVRTLTTAPELAESLIRYLWSDNPVLVRGSLTAAAHTLLFNDRQQFSSATKIRVTNALLAAAENVVRVGDGQTVINFASTIGGVRSERGRRLLWDFVRRRVAYEQALIAITWSKDLKDLPRLAAILDAPATGDTMSSELSSLPYALRNGYGAAAIPVLERVMKNSGYVWVRTQCARELVLEGRPSGFAFIADAIEQNQFYKREMVYFVQERFPELRDADEAAVLAFLKRRAR